MLGDFLYALNADDEQKTPIQSVIHRRSVALANVSVFNRLQVPDGFGLHLAFIHATGSPGATQICNAITVGVELDIGGQNINFATILGASYANYSPTPGVVDWWQDISLYLPERTVLFCSGQFNAGGNPNIASLQLFGYLIPMGNVALGSMVEI